jgi:hypothetical protein
LIREYRLLEDPSDGTLIVQLWQGIAFSLGMDADKSLIGEQAECAIHSSASWMWREPRVWPHNPATFLDTGPLHMAVSLKTKSEVPHSFRKRLKAAKSHIGHALGTTGEIDIHIEVTLGTIADFAARMGWDVPADFPPPSKGSREVRWDVWLQKPTVELWQAVALSLNISPDLLADHGRFSMAEAKYAGLPEEFVARYEIVSESVVEQLPVSRSRPRERHSGPAHILVRLIEFAAFAHAKNWELPQYLRPSAVAKFFSPPYPSQKLLCAVPDGELAESAAAAPQDLHRQRKSGQAGDECSAPEKKELLTLLKIIAGLVQGHGLADTSKTAAEIERLIRERRLNPPACPVIVDALNLAATLINSGKVSDPVQRREKQDLLLIIAVLVAKEDGFKNLTDMGRRISQRLGKPKPAKIKMPSISSYQHHLKDAADLIGARKK